MLPSPSTLHRENGFDTVIWPADADGIALAARWLREGHPVGFPTETVYGLGADASRDDAVQRIFSTKGRPADNPLICHVADAESASHMVTGLDDPSGRARLLASVFWPGPLTLVLPVRQHDDPGRIPVSRLVTAGLDTVGVRVPAHPVALALLRACGPGLAVAAPSANLSGRPSPTCAQHVLADLVGRIPGVLDGGDCSVGVESTVLDCTCHPFVILRPGGVTLAQLRGVLGEEDVVMGSGSVEKIAPSDTLVVAKNSISVPAQELSEGGRAAASNGRAMMDGCGSIASSSSVHDELTLVNGHTAADGHGAAQGQLANGVATSSAANGHDGLAMNGENGPVSQQEGAKGKKPSGPKAPGMKYVHYAPRRAAIHFVSSTDDARLLALVTDAKGRGQRVGVMRPRTGGATGGDSAAGQSGGVPDDSCRAPDGNGALFGVATGGGNVESEGFRIETRAGDGQCLGLGNGRAGAGRGEYCHNRVVEGGEAAQVSGGHGEHVLQGDRHAQVVGRRNGAHAADGMADGACTHADGAGTHADVGAGGADVGPVCADVVRYCGSMVDPDSVARELYRCLRSFDEDEDAGRGVDVVFAYGFSVGTVGEAVLNRLLHASVKTVV